MFWTDWELQHAGLAEEPKIPEDVGGDCAYKKLKGRAILYHLIFVHFLLRLSNLFLSLYSFLFSGTCIPGDFVNESEHSFTP